MTNEERISLVKTSIIDSGLKEAVLHLLGEDGETGFPTSLIIKNAPRGNTDFNGIQKGDAKITFTDTMNIKFMMYKGVGNPGDNTNWSVLGGFETTDPIFED